jgi:hypothetical protein
MRRLPSFTARYGYVGLALPGILVLAVAVLLFESSANLTTSGFTQVIDDLLARSQRHAAGAAGGVPLPHATAAEQGKPHTVRPSLVVLAEVKARYIWLSTVLLSLVMSCYVSVNCGIILYRNRSHARLLLLGGIGAVLSIAGIAFLGMLTEDDVLYRAVYAFTYQSLARSGYIQEGLLQFTRLAVSALNVLAVLAPIIAVLAACSIIAPPADSRSMTPDTLIRRMRQLNEVLYGGSAILVTGILHMGAWLRWPASLIADRTSQQAVLGVALAITIFWGTTFTLMLIVTYVPAAVSIARQAHILMATGQYAGTIPDTDGWLKQHGFHLSIEQHLLQFGALLAPVLAGPLGSFLLAPLDLLDQ